MRPPDPEVVRALIARPLQVVAGKGGVGRTAIAAALALHSAKSGARTLLLEVNSADSAASYLDIEPSNDIPKEAFDNLWHCKMTPAGSMKEYALMVLRFKALYALVFENKLVKYLLRSIPSLAEFTMLGKTWYHATETLPDGSPKYQRIIIDAPATGHAITFLSVARIVADIAPSGIMKTASEKMAQVIESKSASCLHVVALPEEMPVNEGLEIVAAGEKRLHMARGVAFVNRIYTPLSQDDESLFLKLETRAKTEPQLEAFVTAAKLRLDKERLQAMHAERFAEESRMPCVLIPELETKTFDRAAIEKIAKAIGEAAGS
jgi:anion-transporting  ArsA/GET3 family ATPase